MRHRWVGGVCSGLARFIDLDVFPIRMLFRIIFLFWLPMLWWVYLLLWVIIPPQNPFEPERVVVVKERRPELIPPNPKRLSFDAVLARASGRVSERLLQKIAAVDASGRALLPHLSRWRTLWQPELATVRRALLEYFPQAVQAYLDLPRDYAEHHRLQSGQTPEEKLIGELETLLGTLNRVLESLDHHDKIELPEDLRRLAARLQESTPSDDIERTLEQLVQRSHNRLPEEIAVKVASITSAIRALLPQLAGLGASASQEAYNVRKTATEYLPDALEKYLALPPSFAEHHRLSNGKTAKETLLEQLELLERTMHELLGDLYQQDADALLIHGRFLKEKFAEQRFALPGEVPTSLVNTPEQLRAD